MYAFVPRLGLAAGRPALPSKRLSICGPTPPLLSTSKSPSAFRMSIHPGITLQTLVYTPSPNVSGIEDKDIMCNMVWTQVFGNAYVMESEREEAYVYESMYRAGRISLKEFVRGCALSQTYRRRFFECCAPYRAVELNFKHLLGRAPISQQEVSDHVQRIATDGYAADINSYIDSEEYEEAFGADFVPYIRFKGTYKTIEEFNRMCTMYSSPGTSDKSLTIRARALGVSNPNHVLSLDGAGVPSKLAPCIAMNSKSTFVTVAKAIPGRPDLDLGFEKSKFAAAMEKPVNENSAPRKRVEISMGNYMYLTDKEAKEYASQRYEEEMIVSYAQKEADEARAQIAALEARLAELALVG